jgi:hypothetical protein
MAMCLRDGGVSAVTGDGDLSEQIVIAASEPYRICAESGLCESSGGADSGDMTEEQWQDLSAEFDAMAEPYLDAANGIANLLLVGEKDFTKLYRDCLIETGYKAPALPAVEGDELAYKVKVAEAGVKWANCARDNGYPAVKDPNPPVADGYLTIPAATAPFSMSTDQLRDLLGACPNIDVEGHLAQEEAATHPSANDEPIPPVHDPIISFDFPGWNGARVEGADLDPLIIEKLEQFQLVMDEAAEAALASAQAE